MREIEAQPVGRHERALLLHVSTENLTQSRMQQVRRAVIQRDRAPALAINRCIQSISNPDCSLRELADVRMRGATLLRVRNDEAHTNTGKHARVAHLSARLGVERRAIENHLAFLTLVQGINGLSALQQDDNMPLRLQAFIALEQSARINRSSSPQVDPKLACGLGALLLLLHRDVEAHLVDGEPALASDIGGQIGRESIGVIKFEHRLAVYDLTLKVADGLFE